jgi:hypothetical protein
MMSRVHDEGVSVISEDWCGLDPGRLGISFLADIIDSGKDKSQMWSLVGLLTCGGATDFDIAISLGSPESLHLFRQMEVNVRWSVAIS